MHLTEKDFRLVSSYDRMFSNHEASLTGLQGDEGLANLGYFEASTQDLAGACANLVRRLVAPLTGKAGPLLDVGCGVGGTTALIADHFPDAPIHAVNISKSQIDICRQREPRVSFEVMRAEALAYSNDQFEIVTSVEAATHFKGRREFLQEAVRVLRPGGQLAVADMLFHTQPKAFRAVLSDQELYPDIESYRRLWAACGLVDIRVEDVTGPVVRGFSTHARAACLRALVRQQIEPSHFASRLRMIERIEQLPVSVYVLAWARKA
jgi:2-polyprenyl-3-methyl-5-hydroxy-6-metoxy-1,4-benzoquinol methylase